MRLYGGKSSGMEEKEVAEIVERGPFDPWDTMFATGHHTEDRFVSFEFLTVTLDDIMRECAVPEEQREERRLRHRRGARRFLRHYAGPEKTVPLLEE